VFLEKFCDLPEVWAHFIVNEQKKSVPLSIFKAIFLTVNSW